MKIAFTSKQTGWESEIDPRFGRTPYLLILDDQTGDLQSFDNGGVEKEAHGAGSKTAQKLFNLEADVLITGNGPGKTAQSLLKVGNVEVYTGAGEMTVRQAYDAYQNKTLTMFAL